MFVTPAPKQGDPMVHLLLGILGQDAAPKEIEPGLIQIASFNGEHEFWLERWQESDLHFPGDDFPTHGVCDSPEQWKTKFYERVLAHPETWCVTFTHVEKDPGPYGWRWHKWGEYVGGGTPTREYLGDEDGFEDGVYVFHVHQVLRAFGRVVGPEGADDA